MAITNNMLTCRQASVVDYFICTYELLCYIVNMQSFDFSSLFSDVIINEIE